MGDIIVEASKASIVACGDNVAVTLSGITSSGCADKALVEALGEDWVASLISAEVLIASLAARGDEVSIAAQTIEEKAEELHQLLRRRWED